MVVSSSTGREEEAAADDIIIIVLLAGRRSAVSLQQCDGEDFDLGVGLSTAFFVCLFHLLMISSGKKVFSEGVKIIEQLRSVGDGKWRARRGGQFNTVLIICRCVVFMVMERVDRGVCVAGGGVRRGRREKRASGTKNLHT